MAKLSEPHDFNGFRQKTSRLKLEGLVAEVEHAIGSVPVFIEEARHANGTKGIRRSIDAEFGAIAGWLKVTTGGVDWTKTTKRGATVGVEVQVSGRSDMLAVDIMHLKERLVDGTIDAGIIVVPDDLLSRYLTDRTPNLATALRHVRHRASDLPIRVWSFMHDGVGSALEKMRTNLGRLS